MTITLNYHDYKEMEGELNILRNALKNDKVAVVVAEFSFTRTIYLKDGAKEVQDLQNELNQLKSRGFFSRLFNL